MKNKGNKNNNSKKKTANGKNSTVKTIKKQNKFEYLIVNIICIFLFVAFGYIAIMSFLQTSVFDQSAYSDEKIIYQMDNIALNIFCTAVFAVFVFKMKKRYDFFAKVNLRFMEVGLVVYTILLGLIWIFSVASVPAADSQSVFETATGAAVGDYTSITGNGEFYNSAYYNGHAYYNYYPFQLGFVFISEIVYRIFGTSSSMPVQVINVICVAVAYLGIAKITKLVFKKRSIEFIAILLLAGCFQPMLFSTFVYGNIIGMCCAIWASYFLIKYFQTSKYLLLLPCAGLLVLATMAKYNNMIYLVAFVIMLIIHTVKEKKWQSIAFALALCIATVGINNLVILSYESRANTKLADGISQTMYLDMGLNDSYMAPGWYNGIAFETYKNSNLDNKVADRRAWNDIKNRLDLFGKNPGYAIDFFGKKIVSQWNEPTFESIWVSEVKSHSYNVNSIGNGMYNGSLGQFFELYFNLYMQILYILFVIGIYCLFQKRRTNIETVLLLLVILGGFGYHLLFEGKSQYVLTYIILLIPTAAFGMNTILEGKYTKVKEIVGKLKAIPEKKNA